MWFSIAWYISRTNMFANAVLVHNPSHQWSCSWLSSEQQVHWSFYKKIDQSFLDNHICMWLCLVGMYLNQYSTSGASGQYSTKSAYEAFFVGATLGKNLEELGTWQVQILHVDGSTQKMLDSWTPCKKGTSPPCTLSSLWSGWRNFRPPFGLLCFFPSILVQLAAGPWTASTCPRFGWWDLRWLVGQFEQQGVLSDQKRS